MGDVINMKDFYWNSLNEDEQEQIKQHSLSELEKQLINNFYNHILMLLLFLPKEYLVKLLIDISDKLKREEYYNEDD